MSGTCVKPTKFSEMWGQSVVDWAYVNGMGDEGGDPDHDIHDPDGHCGGQMFGQLVKSNWIAQAPGKVNRGNRGSVYGPPLECKYCGQTGLYWQIVKGAYRTHEICSLQPHICPPKEDNLEGFD